MVHARHSVLECPDSWICILYYVPLLVAFFACRIQESTMYRNVVGFTTSVARLEGLDGSAFLSMSLDYVKTIVPTSPCNDLGMS